MIRAITPRRRSASPDEGFALMGVVMLMLVLLLACSVVVSLTVSGSRFQRKQQDWNAALAAAQAGIDDYLQRLNNTDGGYYQYDGTTSVDPANPAMSAPGSPLTWAPVPQSDGGTGRASFHYSADTAAYTGAGVPQTGVITVTSTGKVGTRTRTLRTQLRRSGFLDNLYFTEYETQDPAQGTNSTACALKHYYDGRPASCRSIQFGNDRLSGPVHSNDTMLICQNVVFSDKVTSATPDQGSGKYYRDNGCGSASPAPVFQAGVPTQVPIIPVPSTNQSVKQQTVGSAATQGCLFVGPTTITLNKTQMFVHSPWTRTSPRCALDQWITIPANGTVYVDDRPANDSTDPNSWSTADAASVQTLCDQQVGDGITSGNPVGYPLPTEAGWSYPCTAGDAFVQELDGAAANGLTGRLTVATSGNIYITDNLHYGPSSGILGLIANQSVWYWHPTDHNHSNINLPAKQYPAQAAKSQPLVNPTVSAAMVSLQHSIGTMHYDQGASLGTLTINGSLTQFYRGVVKQGASGYDKNYVYDQRLRYDSPPHFLNPTTSRFAPTLSAEIAPQVRVSG